MLSGSLPPLQFGARDQDRTFSSAKRWGTDKGGQRRLKRREVRREEKSEEKRRLEPEMSGDHSDGEGSVGHEADFVGTTGDREVELRLPLEVDKDPDRPREDIRTHSGAVAPSAVDLGHEEQRRLKPPNWAKPKWHGHRLSLPLDTEPHRQPTAATAHVAWPGTARHRPVIGREWPNRHIRVLSNDDRGPGLGCPLASILKKNCGTEKSAGAVATGEGPV